MDNFFIFGVIIVATMAIQIMTTSIRNIVINIVVFLICSGAIWVTLIFTHEHTITSTFIVKCIISLFFTIIYFLAIIGKSSAKNTQ